MFHMFEFMARPEGVGGSFGALFPQRLHSVVK